MSRKIVCELMLVVAVSALAACVAAASAAAAPAPSWVITAVATPTNFTTADSEFCEPRINHNCDAYVVTVTNVGNAPSSGRVTIKDTLPRGIVVAGIGREEDTVEGALSGACFEEVGAKTVTCSDGDGIPPGGAIVVDIEVSGEAEGRTLVTDVAEVEGGGAPGAVTAAPGTEPNTVNGPSPAFGPQDFGVGAYGPDGTLATQAGAHPATVSTTINYTTLLNPASAPHGDLAYRAVQEPKTEEVDLPLGLVGDPLAAAQCPEGAIVGVSKYPSQCPAGSVVGEALIDTAAKVESERIYNIVPESGYPAEFAFEFDSADVYLRARVLPSSRGYVLSVSVPDIIRTTNVYVTGATITFFGDPTEQDGEGNGEAFLTNPDDCAAPGRAGSSDATLEMDSWVDPGHWVSPTEEAAAGVLQPLTETAMFEASSSHSVTGCGLLQFEPQVQVHPEQSTTDTPSGYEIDLKVPQARNAPGILATPDVKDAVIQLPEGLSISPSAANGLQACQASGPEGIELGASDSPFDENKVQEGEEIGLDGLAHATPGHCPSASQIGEVEVITPLLAQPLHGHVYVAEPSCGGAGQPECTPAAAADGELYGLYLEVAGSGVVVKLKGNVSANPQTGQLTTTFTETPQLPFSELKLRLNGGQRAPLANPQSCGTFTATSDLTPWSSPETPDATPSAPFVIGGCPGATPFAPGFLAQTTTPLAGAFSPFTLTFSRHDGEQDLSGLTVNMPPGLLAKLAGLAQCPEAPANAGTCAAVSPSSQIGTATAAAGAGSAPYWQSGPVFLTGPYNGAPFGLSVVVPAKAGPYNLGNIVVRAAIHINPSTAAVTVVSNPLPQIIDGVPLRVQTINVTVGEPGTRSFTFNGTNCSSKSVNAVVSSAQGAVANVSSPYAATGCASLPFKPGFSASTQGKASKAGGASLIVRVTSKGGPGTPGEEANIAKVALQFPKQINSRLTTLQKACTESQFNSNPAGCPGASNIGTAAVHTPLLSGPLAGPVYLVSHGNAAFPDVEIILQGEGVELILDGKTQIKKGITYSHFETVPDAPFSTFETKLPTGKFSIFGANLPASSKYNFCGQSLAMPTVLTGQNGAVVKQTTPVEVEGCPNTISVSSHKVKGKTATLSVYVAAAGKLTATGKGLSSGSKTASGQETITVTVSQKKPGKLKTSIKLSFTPVKGKKQSKSLTVRFTR